MRIDRTIFFRSIVRKAATLLFIAASAATAFATLGDGKTKSKKPFLLNNRQAITPGRFSLKSGYQYRGSQIINQERDNTTITLNSLVTYQKGHMTYILPMRTTFNTQKIKISVGIPMLNKN